MSDQPPAQLSVEDRLILLESMLAEILETLAEIRPYLPLLARAAALIDNPAQTFRRSIRKGKGKPRDSAD